jgi:hypothetical protein
MLILENILQYSFIFSVKKKFEKNNFPKISASFFWNYFMPNLLVGCGNLLDSIERNLRLKPNKLTFRSYGYFPNFTID